MNDAPELTSSQLNERESHPILEKPAFKVAARWISLRFGGRGTLLLCQIVGIDVEISEYLRHCEKSLVVSRLPILVKKHRNYGFR